MRYVVVDTKDGDMFTSECGTLEEATAEAEKQFACLTEADKKKRAAFYVLESVNPDEEAEDHLDGEIVKRFI